MQLADSGSPQILQFANRIVCSSQKGVGAFPQVFYRRARLLWTEIQDFTRATERPPGDSGAGTVSGKESTQMPDERDGLNFFDKTLTIEDGAYGTLCSARI